MSEAEEKEEKPDQEVVRWHERLKGYDREFEKYEQRCEKIRDYYRDERDSVSSSKSRYNVFWAHQETQKTAIFARTPKNQVSRRFGDKSDIGRLAAQILERNIQYQLDTRNFTSSAKDARDDFMLYARGTLRAMYGADLVKEQYQVKVYENIDQETGQQLDPPYFTEDGQPVDPAEVKQGDQGLYTLGQYEVVKDEYVDSVYVHRSDFRHAKASRWNDEIRWVAYDSKLTKCEVEKRFGAEVAASLSYKREKGSTSSGAGTHKDQEAVITEIWCREKKKVYWVSEGYDKFLDQAHDPLELKHFFPSPKPAYGTGTTDTLLPIPDYAMVQDIIREIDDVTTRISKLTKACKVAGIYNAAVGELKKLIDEGTDTKLIPAKDWRALTENKGLEGLITWMPLEQIAKVLKVMYEVRRELLQAYYEITGNSDIVRGATDPRETARAQSIKSQSYSTRMAEKQEEFARFLQDHVRIVGEIIAEHFSDDTLLRCAGSDVLSQYNEQQIQAALDMLRTERLRDFNISIDTDSMIISDEQADKESANEFVSGVTSLMEKLLPTIQSLPSFGKVASVMLMKYVRTFRFGRDTESALEEFIDNLPEELQRMQEQQKEAEQSAPDTSEQELAIKAQTSQGQLQIKAQESQASVALKQREIQGREQLQAEKQQIEAQLKEGELEIKELEALLKHAEKQAELEQKGRLAQGDALLELARPSDSSHRVRVSSNPETGDSEVEMEQTGATP